MSLIYQGLLVFDKLYSVIKTIGGINNVPSKIVYRYSIESFMNPIWFPRCMSSSSLVFISNSNSFLRFIASSKLKYQKLDYYL